MRWRHGAEPGAEASQGGFALLTAIAFLVLILALGGVMVQQAIYELGVASRAKKETRAFNLAEAGIDYAAWQLYNNPSTILPATWSRSDLEGGSFTVSADRDPDTADAIVLLSTGTSQGWTSEVKVVGVFLETGGGGQNAVFDYALFSDADLLMSGSFSIVGDAHTNGNATVRGGVELNGDLSASGSVAVQGNPDIEGDVVADADRIAMPTIDLEYYRNNATYLYTGDYTFSGDTTLDGVVFIEGDAHISGNFSGSGVIVVDGDVHINGNATRDGEGDEFAIVSSGTVRVNGNCRIEGWIYTHNADVPGMFSGNGNADIVGGLAADSVTCTGNMDIEYRTPTVDLPGSSSAPSQFDGVSWRRLR